LIFADKAHVERSLKVFRQVLQEHPDAAAKPAPRSSRRAG